MSLAGGEHLVTVEPSIIHLPSHVQRPTAATLSAALLESPTTDMTLGLAAHYHCQPFQEGPRYNSPFMAGPMQSNKDPVAISNPLSGNSTSILTSPPDPIPYLKHSTSKPESHLTSIASAGFRTSPSPGLSNQRQLSPRMASTTTTGPA
jgi:hypothetical protein